METGRLSARIATCTKLWSGATDPEVRQGYWLELTGLRVAAGESHPLRIDPGTPVRWQQAYQQGLQDGELLRQLDEEGARAAPQRATDVGDATLEAALVGHETAPPPDGEGRPAPESEDDITGVGPDAH